MKILSNNKKLRKLATKVAKVLKISSDAMVMISYNTNLPYGCLGRMAMIKENTYIVEIGNLTKKDTLTTIAHEMIHVAQYDRGDLVQKRNLFTGTKVLWKGVDHTNTEYRSKPWEIEAFDNQDRIMKLAR